MDAEVEQMWKAMPEQGRCLGPAERIEFHIHSIKAPGLECCGPAEVFVGASLNLDSKHLTTLYQSKYLLKKTALPSATLVLLLKIPIALPLANTLTTPRYCLLSNNPTIDST